METTPQMTNTLAAPKGKSAKKRDTIYKVTIAGLYFAVNTGQGTQKPFSIDVNYDQQMVDTGVIGVFKRLLAADMMRPRYPDFIGLAEADVVDVVTNDGSEINDLQLMTRQMIEAYIQDAELPIEVRLYDDTHALRQAVRDCVADQGKFVEQQQILVARKSGKLSIKSAALRLNSAATSFAPAATIDPEKQPLVPPNAPPKSGKKDDKDVLGNL